MFRINKPVTEPQSASVEESGSKRGDWKGAEGFRGIRDNCGGLKHILGFEKDIKEQRSRWMIRQTKNVLGGARGGRH